MKNRRANLGGYRVLAEPLESRLLLSATIRVVAYNIEADIDGVTTPRSGLYQVLEGIGEEKVQGDVQPIDIVGLEETTSNSTTVAPIVSALNTYYNGAAVYAQGSYQATSSGGDVADGNGPSAVVYNTKTLKLLASVGVGTPGGATNGEYRQVARYEFQPVADSGSTGIFYVYVVHAKSLASGSTSTDQKYQQEEATIIRNDEVALPANSSVIYMGDWNVDASTDPSMVEMSSAGQGQAFDPLNPTNQAQNWATNPTYQGIMTESSTDLRYRDDLQLMTSNVLNDAAGGLDYVAGSDHAFGNNGTTPEGGSVNSGSDTALNSDLVQDGGTFISASTLYADLTTGSDHLPVVADYTVPTTTTTPVPTIGSFTITPSSVTTGSSITLTASNVTETGGTINHVTFYRESNGTAGLQIGSDTLVGNGANSGTTWMLSTSTSGLAAGKFTYYAVATDSTSHSSAAASASVTVTAASTAEALLTWNVKGQSNFGKQGLSPSSVGSGVSDLIGLTRGSGVGTNASAAANAWGGNHWASTSSAGISANETVAFGLVVTKSDMSLSSINLNYRRSSTGPSSGLWQYEVNGGAWTTIANISNEFSSSSSSGATIAALNLSGISALQNLAAGTKVEIRLIPYGATTTAGTWYVYDINGKDLVVNGKVTAAAQVAKAAAAFAPVASSGGNLFATDAPAIASCLSAGRARDLFHVN